MEEFGFALRVAREKRGLTQTQVMQLTGINNKTLYHASADRLLRLESRPQARGLSADEAQLLALYRALPEGTRGEVSAMLRALAEHHREST